MFTQAGADTPKERLAGFWRFYFRVMYPWPIGDFDHAAADDEISGYRI